jgi:coniferyl-aldehyde dehydrogenase
MTTTTPADLPALLHTLRSAWQAQRPSLDQREADLRRLREALKPRLDEMAQAIAEDFGHRAHVESKLADGMSVLSAIDHLRRHLRRWSKPQRYRPAGSCGRRARSCGRRRWAWSG